MTSERSTGPVKVGTDNWHHLKELDTNNDVYLPCEFCMTAILMSDFEAHSRTCAQEQNTEGNILIRHMIAQHMNIYLFSS